MNQLSAETNTDGGRFHSRLIAGKSFEAQVERFCRLFVSSVAKNGTEHTHPEFVSHLRGKNDPGSRFVRFAPDGVMLTTGGVIHWEAKASKALERDAYETYLLYESIGCSIRLFVQRPADRAVFSQWVKKIRFVPSANVVGQFPAEKRHPVDAQDWICPRHGSGQSGRGSGTPYREIDFCSLRRIDNFYDVIGEAAA